MKLVNKISRRAFVVLLIAVIFPCDTLIRGAAFGSLKYSHGPLVSALNGHLNEFGSPASSSPVIGANGVVNSGSGVGHINAGGGTVVGGSVNGAAEALQGSSVNGGEVIATKTFPISAQEPTCEQLRAIWIFSKRQSRAAEITNEIPAYRDPFVYNVWEPYYASTRSMGALRMVPRFGERSRLPVFGRVVSREPVIPQRFITDHRQRHFGGESSLLGGGSGHIYGTAESKLNTINSLAVVPTQRRPTQYRYVGANGSLMNGGGSGGNSYSVPPIQGSFKKLKELIWTERAKELTQQRRAEELAARAAVLKEIANGQNIESYNKNAFKSDSPLMDENRSPYSDSYQYMNDGRMSIANGQSLSSQQFATNSKNNNNNNNGGNGKTDFRSYINKADGHNWHKSKIFAGNTGSNRSARLLLPSTIASSYTMNDSYEHNRGGISGISKAYSVIPSYFRERNRSLYKQISPLEYFRREPRQNSNNLHDSSIAEDNKEISKMENIIKNFNYEKLPNNKRNNKPLHEILTGTERKYIKPNNNLFNDSYISAYDDRNILYNDNDILFTDVSDVGGIVSDGNIDDVIPYNDVDLLETEPQSQNLMRELLEYNNNYSY